MFTTSADLFGTIQQFPWIGLLTFVAITLLLFVMFAGRDLIPSLAGIFRVFSTAFTTPFEFLQDALSIIKDASKAEADYLHTREFVLFRYSRLLYMAIFLAAFLYLSAGVTAGILSLYPRSEVAESDALQANLTDLQAQLATANKDLAAAGSPNFAASLRSKQAAATAAYNTQVRRNGEFEQTLGFNSPIIFQIENATDAATVTNLKDGLAAYVADCPTGLTWNNFTPDQCVQFKAKMSELADRKASELSLQAAMTDAATAVQNADTALAEYGAKVADLKKNIADVQNRYDTSSFKTGAWVGNHVWRALKILFLTLFGVLVIVWSGAILIDVFNWVILLMRSMEKTHSERLL